jgi:hypothetical protein
LQRARQLASTEGKHNEALLRRWLAHATSLGEGTIG